MKHIEGSVRRRFFDLVVLPGVSVLLLLLSLYFWGAERRQALARLEETTRLTGAAIVGDTQTRFGDIREALRRLAARQSPGSPGRAQQWEEDAEFYVQAFAGLAHVYWIDEEYLVERTIPLDVESPRIGESAGNLEASLRTLLLWQASREEGSFRGFVVGEVDLSEFMLPAVEVLGDRYALTLRRGPDAILDFNAPDASTKAGSLDSTIDLADSAVLTMALAPTEVSVRRALGEARSTLLTGLLITGVAIAAAFAARGVRQATIQERLRRQWETFQNVLEGIPQAVYVADIETHEVLFANEFIRDAVGTNPVGRDCFEVFQGLDAPCSFCTNEIILDSDAPYTWEHDNPHVGRSYLITDRLIEWPGRKHVRLEIAVDVTDMKEAEKERLALQTQLQQHQKLESIGTLASGVAHEVNNPLMAMMNYSELISGLASSAKVKEYAASIHREGERVATIVRNLLSFARQDTERHSPARIRDIVDASVSLVGSILRRDKIDVQIDVPDALPLVKCRSQQIQQVIVNLLSNARDALNLKYPLHDLGKRIDIRACEHELSGRDGVRVIIEDSGIGMSQDALTRIFDPFFTTKGRDQGTGLGLSVSYGIIKEHCGQLTVESEQGQFTRFYIDLPTWSRSGIENTGGSSRGLADGSDS